MADQTYGAHEHYTLRHTHFYREGDGHEHYEAGPRPDAERGGAEAAAGRSEASASGNGAGAARSEHLQDDRHAPVRGAAGVGGSGHAEGAGTADRGGQ